MSPLTDSSTDTSLKSAGHRWWLDTLLISLSVGGVELALMFILELSGSGLSARAKWFLDAGSLAVTIGPLFAWMLYRQRVDALFHAAAGRHASHAPPEATDVGRSIPRVLRLSIMGSMALIAALVGGALWGRLATEALAPQLQAYGGARLVPAVRMAWLFAGVLCLVIALIAGIVVAPVVRLLRRQHAAIAAQRRRLDLIVSSADLGTWEWDLTTGEVLFNERWAQMLGYPHEDLSSHVSTWTSLTHPDDFVPSHQVMIDHLKGRTPEYRSEQRLRRRDGSWCWVLAAGRVIERDANGRALHAVGVHFDVSDAHEAKDDLEAARARAESALREVSALRSALDEHSIMSVADRSGRILDVNTGFCRSSGYTREELIGRDHRMLNSGTHSQEFWKGLWRNIAVGKPWRGEICNRRKDGTLFWVDSTIIPYMGIDGRIEKYVSIRFDVTPQKRADEDLQRTTALLEEAQAVARLGSWSFDVPTSTMSWSREIYRLHGRREMDGPPSFEDMLMDFVSDGAERLVDAMHECTTEGTPYSLVLRTAKGANGVLYVRAEGRARRHSDGSITTLFGTVMDVTSEIVREEALRQAQLNAEAASRSKSEFLANMSHEIRTPLTAILGYTDLMRLSSETATDAGEQLEAIGTIRRAGEHLLSVLNDVLDVSKIEAGRVIIEEIETSLPNMLLDVESLMRPRAAQKGVALRTSLASAIPERVFIDPTRLRQILLNLVGNAVKFTDEGQVDVRASVMDGPTGPMLQITVADTGSGMTSREAALLFQPFTQADSSVTRRHGGTGLGLTICRRLAQQMQGDVTLVRTVPGRGSCFALSLPLLAVPDAGMVDDLATCIERDPRGAAIRPEDITLRGRILLAEDGEDNQRLIAFQLRRAGADVTVAEHGLDALDAIRAAHEAGVPFGLLVSDMQMPEMDGYTLARTLRAEGNQIPIIALTAHAMDQDRQQCLNAGCDDYASKPIDWVQLLTMSARWMSAPTPEPELFPVWQSPTEARIARTVEESVLYSDVADDPDLRELVVAFVTALPKRAEALRESFDLGNLERLRRGAHQLKGAAGGYGFPTITDAARTVEALSRPDADVQELQQSLDELFAQCRAASRTRPAAPDAVVTLVTGPA